MSGVKKITAWQTSDGRTFDDEDEADRVQSRIDLEALVFEELRGGPIDGNMVVDFMFENARLIVPLLLTNVDDMWLDERCDE